MDPKKRALTAAAVGTALGIGGLAVIAMPASAGDAPPVLPQISAEELAQSAVTAQQPAFDGTVKVTNNLGLPGIGQIVPGANPLSMDSAHIYSDGAGKSKLTVSKGSSQETVVHNGATVWDYNSQTNAATKTTIPADVAKKADAGSDKVTDPTAAAKELLAKVRESSTVSVDGTAKVAGRSAYEVVFTPKPTERTLLREIRVAVDAEKRVPLRLSVMNNGSSEPALQVTFTDIQFAQQSASLFEFTPPKGAKVTEKQPQLDQGTLDQAQQTAEKDVKIVGDGWDTVLTGKVPADLLAGKAPSGEQGQPGRGVDPKAILAKIGKPVSGTWGSGYLITTKVGTAVLADDGRFAAGAVPEQVLFEALGTK
ncbi:LolA family protein [Amycolatopsis sp. H20-H5]|uniref:LolA family protein n=1 Tax=Amycolatopsis sp. H20-H5 TaxID=3046309 RepID=UPI002DBDCDB1|nr:sigma-E factor regulatory protein RseB domain-containing protein [Amycolatopsis sp. H20-H5]MEC3980118.1 sigma-E factor regulatory protein RseB domain-containing protein [Amycolatopsis sp. H20-H5]